VPVAQGTKREGYYYGGLQAFAAHVTHHNQQGSVWCGDQFVKVSPNFKGGPVHSFGTATRMIQTIHRQQRSLDCTRRIHLGGQSVTLGPLLFQSFQILD
jgi:hypothetical protein